MAALAAALLLAAPAAALQILKTESGASSGSGTALDTRLASGKEGKKADLGLGAYSLSGTEGKKTDLGLGAYSLSGAEGKKTELGVTVDSSAGVDAESGESVTFSPEERLHLHAEKFEKEFTIELDMQAAHDNGMPLGVSLDMDTDFNPVSVMKIRKTGLLEAWNKEHPENAVHVGDQIIKVNDILWHHNSQTFADRIKNQFKAARDFRDGAKKILTLSIQRPRMDRQVRFASQREDLHRQLYSKDFVVDVPVRQDKGLGWQLNSTVDWVPVAVNKIRAFGIVADWNADHPEAKILVGDEIVQVDQIGWHHNSVTFEDRVNAHFTKLQRTNDTTAKMSLHIQRPRHVREVVPDQVFSKDWNVSLRVPDTDGVNLGMDINFTSDSEPVFVSNLTGKGVLALWNAENPEKQLAVGDNILRVNGIAWHSNSRNFAKQIPKEYAMSFPRELPHGGFVDRRPTIELAVSRRDVRSVQKEWTVSLDADEGQMLGWQLNSSLEEWPVVVSKIRSQGAVSKWNQQHPESVIRAGDQIVKVNDVLWRQDSSDFERRLNEEYSRSKKAGTLTLFMRRFTHVDPIYLEDDLNKPFSKEFSVELPVDEGKPLGFQLNGDSEEEPASIDKIRKFGSVAEWNELHPLDQIEVGDQIVKVNSVIWHNNTQTFMERMHAQLDAARTGKGTIELLIQRPWKQQQDVADLGDSDDVVGGGEEDEVVGGGEDEVGSGESEAGGGESEAKDEVRDEITGAPVE